MKEQNVETAIADKHLLTTNKKQDDILYIEKVMIISFVIIGAIFNILFLFLEQTPITKSVHIVGLLMVGVNWMVYMATNSFWFVRHNMVFMGMVSIVPWLITGGPENMGFIWIVPFILWAFFLTGSIGGSLWILLTFILSLGIVVLSVFDVFSIAYSFSELLQLFMMAFLTTALAYSFDWSRRMYERTLVDQRNALTSSNDELEKEIVKREAVELSLKTQNQELEKMNKFMVDRELKMVELKKEMAKLKGIQQ